MSSFENGAIRLEYILDAPLSENVERQWPQMNEVVKGRDLVARVEAEFDTFTLEVGRRLTLDDVVIVEWSCDYGDGRIYRNVTIGELKDGMATKVTDYWGEPSEIPSWRQAMTAPLIMAANGIWPDGQHLLHS